MSISIFAFISVIAFNGYFLKGSVFLILNIKRENSRFDQYRNYKIILDGKLLGKLSSNETKSFKINSGSHIIYVKIDWCRSNKIKFNSSNSSNSSINLECGSFANNALKGLLVFIYATVFRRKYLWLKYK